MTAQTPKAARGSATPAHVDVRTGRLSRARWLASPNHDERPDGSGVSLLVIHNISLPPDQFGGGWIDDLFLNRLDYNAHPYFDGLRELKVSAHCCIFRDGSLTQYVSFNQRAWHAGKSQFQGRERCNDFSIGIELEGCDTKPFSKAQYRRLLRVTRALQLAYPDLISTRIVGHSDIAPGRKTDPGPHFDWAYFKDELGS